MLMSASVPALTYLEGPEEHARGNVLNRLRRAQAGDTGRLGKRMESCHLELQRLLVKPTATQRRDGKQRVEKGAPGVRIARKGHAYQGISDV
ncbi:unnamed protein product [Clonostachys rosea]|uniref:Uncharacterized protein n=1 Tax=Bionectria ochroleuca TaxID=29856 RepID=A0ABY6TXR9_BIOOC|nr:unnamed protein product [Clonostachys rosea]